MSTRDWSPNKRRYSEELWADAKQRFMDGQKLVRIEDATGIPSKTISCRAIREIWPRTNRVYHRPNPVSKSFQYRRCEVCCGWYEGKECDAEGHNNHHPIKSLYLEPKMEKAA